MAGTAVLSTFLQVLFEKLSAAALDELRLLRGVDDGLRNLSSTLSTIQDLVEDAEEKQFTERAVRSWLSKLKDVAYEIDELLDEYAAEALRLKLKGQRHVSGIFYYLSLRNSRFNYKIAKQIKAIQEKLDKLAKDRDVLGLQMFVPTSRVETTERTKSSSLVDYSRVFGREEDKEKIVSILLSTNKSARIGLSILPIVGMGGLGKTTITQLVYNDVRISQYFQLRMWVHVSENFNEMKLTKETLESVYASGFSCATTNMITNMTTNMNLLQEDLCDKVKGKRFLLVLDDVWNTNFNKWNVYYNALSAGERGSKIVITTQNENVGRMMGALPSYHLTELSDEDSWKLFKNYAFVDGNSSAYPYLEEIGKEIVKKLKGLPLAAKALACLLCKKMDEGYWMNILKSEIWELPPDKNDILPALRLSYKHLTPHLKQCFAFCSVFHKDYVFEREKLVQIWMALGFLQTRGKERMEDVGNNYFDDLLSTSFFQFHKGKYMMQYAIHGLAQSVALDDCLRLEDLPRGTNTARVKHLSFSCNNSKQTSFQDFYEFQGVRTLLLLHGYKSKTASPPNDLFDKLRYLRVLELCRRDISELPDSIGNLKQLRYLNLSGTGIKKLPSSISKLYNLQTLKLRHCNELDEIPKGVTKLINLRHLEASTTLVTAIAKIGSLTNLQELEEYVVRKDKGFKISELKKMSELRGHLCIRNLEDASSKDDGSEAMLSGKEYLTVLDLVWSEDRKATLKEEHWDEQVLESLRLHTRLKELTIKGFAGRKFPSWLDSSCYLHTIHLSDCIRCKTLPPLGRLPSLKYLDIGGLHSVAQIGQEFSGNGADKGFPSLKELVLDDMSNLEEWVCEGEDEFLPCLAELEVRNCPVLRELPHLPPTLERLQISETGIQALPTIRGSSSSSLSSLQIHACANLKSLKQGLSAQQLSDLKNVTITDCEELISLPEQGFRSLTSLASLHIYNCPRLTPLAGNKGGSLLPHKLKDLQIRSCSKLINSLLSELKNLPFLAHLKIANCDDLHFFPEQGLPVALEVLGISHCKNLQHLPADLSDLSSLKTLSILSCPQIPYLPVSGLPDSLSELHISDCPMLAVCCRQNWFKICHIPNIEVKEDEIMPERKVRRRRR